MDVSSLFRVVQPPATSEEIARLRSACGGALPRSYVEFLGVSNGAEWGAHDVGGDCLALWPAGEVVELNRAYEIPRWLPEFLAIGSDGGGDAVGFDRVAAADPERWPVVRIGFGDLDRADFVRLASGFREWWLAGFRLAPLECAPMPKAGPPRT